MLPPNVKALIKTSNHFARQRMTASSRGNIVASNNVSRISANRQADELSPTSAAAVQTVLMQPSAPGDDE